ncbi:MAG: hypothetical protein A2Y75_01585 [Candidatus Solincola sediminis]|uniref:Uncharacterized protein n=1 Tax=Candidatus Solincola sediminis TaxID=1797199 RepID=A0A1F2WNL4_9ACTN|nr:MAG: hypothetical protein A2Y75_01585 [Candidatus Solincola sediminis]
MNRVGTSMAGGLAKPSTHKRQGLCANPRRSKNPTEAQEMAVLADYLDASGLLWCHVPNESRRSPRQGARLKRLGMKAGVPDVLIFGRFAVIDEKMANARWYIGVAIELKRKGGSVVSPEQRVWGNKLEAAGWFWAACCGADEVLSLIRNRVIPEGSPLLCGPQTKKGMMVSLEQDGCPV